LIIPEIFLIDVYVYSETDHAESVAGFDVSGIGTEFQEAVSGLGPVLGSNGERSLRSFG
jgi:hypothetical protein